MLSVLVLAIPLWMAPQGTGERHALHHILTNPVYAIRTGTAQ